MMQTGELRQMPPFISDKFALKLLLDLGGKATTDQIREHLGKTYDTCTFPNAWQYLYTQYNSLIASYYVGIKGDKKCRNRELYITDDARPIVERMMMES